MLSAKGGEERTRKRVRLNWATTQNSLDILVSWRAAERHESVEEMVAWAVDDYIPEAVTDKLSSMS